MAIDYSAPRDVWSELVAIVRATRGEPASIEIERANTESGGVLVTLTVRSTLHSPHTARLEFKASDTQEQVDELWRDFLAGARQASSRVLNLH